MNATLYLPHQPPQPVPADGLAMPDPATGLVGVPAAVPILLECAAELVDVLASGPGFVAYLIFDCEGEVNPAAMAAVGELAGVGFELDDEDAVLRGPVLVIR
ncbi:hypothetical protein [Hymenobacter sp. UYCo722]|uniref:hypothetical protein n=1 Tax=Hymenobacter sp. UYCo722 TaxID=3156335 RepID=UPI0033954CE0